MASPVSADLLASVEDEATEMIVGYLKGVVAEMLVDGRAPGDVELSRQGRILQFQQMTDRSSGTSEMDSLVVVNPQLAKQYVDQYNRDIQASPPFTGRY